MVRCATARAAMFITTLPSLIVCGASRTPGWVAPTSRCGVVSLSSVASSSARNRDGRWLLVSGAAGIAAVSLRERPQVALLRRGAPGDARVAEDSVAVVLDAVAAA